jgi:hypothetical protein
MRRALLLLAVLAAPLAAQPAERVRIGLIIDDLGNSLRDGERAARLPGAVACAVLPHTPHARELATRAHAAGKEVLLHLPLEARETAEPGPGQIDARMPAGEVRATLDYDLSTVPHAIGINNHMGSLFTTQRAALAGLMHELRRRQLFFVDSRTAADSIAAGVAERQGIPVLARDVFLDDDPSADAVAAQLTQLERQARRHGYALGIGHPHPATLAALEQWLPQLAARGIDLVPLTTRLTQLNPEAKPWHASWSR